MKALYVAEYSFIWITFLNIGVFLEKDLMLAFFSEDDKKNNTAMLMVLQELSRLVSE